MEVIPREHVSPDLLSRRDRGLCVPGDVAPQAVVEFKEVRSTLDVILERLCLDKGLVVAGALCTRQEFTQILKEIKNGVAFSKGRV